MIPRIATAFFVFATSALIAQTPAGLIERGLRERTNKQYVAAIKTFEEAAAEKETALALQATYYMAETYDLIGNIGLAAALFGRVAQGTNAGSLRAQALLARGAIREKTGDFAEAIEDYGNVERDETVESEKRADAMFRAGMCRLARKEMNPASEIFMDVSKRYPATKAAKKAAQRLRLLDGGGK